MKRSLQAILLSFLLCGAASISNAADVFLFNGEKYNLVIIDESDEKYRKYVFELLISAWNKQNIISGKIESCSLMLDLPIGTRNGNHSYGAVCTLRMNGKNKDFMICADKMVGHNAIMFSLLEDFSEQKLATFTALNCYGG